MNTKREQEIDKRLMHTRVVLVSYARINFESKYRFLSDYEYFTTGRLSRPILIFDETIESVTIASMSEDIVTSLFHNASVIGQSRSIYDFNPNESYN